MQRSSRTAEPVAEYEHLARKKRERRGNVEETTVTDVYVGEREVVLRGEFDWAGGGVRISYDLDDDRDVGKLEALTADAGFAFEQVGHLEGSRIEVVCTGADAGWVPTAHESYVDGRGSIGETFRTELSLLARELARSPRLVSRGIRGVRTLSLQQVIIAVIIVALLAWLSL